MSLKTCSVLVLLIVATLVGFFFQDLVSVDVEISQVKRFDTFMNCYQDDLCQYVSSITQFSVGFCTILFPLNLIFFTIFDLVNCRAATIHSPHDTIRIAILASWYDTYRDTLFRLEIISNCMRIILWSSTMVFTILQSLFEIVHSHMFNIFVKVL